jgi:hypothetical protein
LAVAVLLTPAALADVCRGDADCSGSVNFDDINYFVSALAGGEPGWSLYYQNKNGCLPPCTYANCDANGDLSVNFDDINPFVSLLVTPPVCAAVPGWPCPDVILDNSVWPAFGPPYSTNNTVLGTLVSKDPAQLMAWQTLLDSQVPPAPIRCGSFGGPVIDSDGFVYFKTNEAVAGNCWLYKFNPATGAVVAQANLGPGADGNRSGPIIARDRIFVANRPASDIKVFDKSLNYLYQIKDPAIPAGDRGYRGIALATVDNTNGHANIYATRRDTTPNTVYCFDSVTGALMWTWQPPVGTGTNALGQMGPFWVDGGQQCFTIAFGGGAAYTVIALQDSGGNAPPATLWTTPFAESSFSGAGALSPDGTRIYLSSDGTTNMRAIDRATGAVIWSVPGSALLGGALMTQPAVVQTPTGPRIYTLGRGCNLNVIDDLGATYSVAWRLTPGAWTESQGLAVTKNSTTGRTFIYMTGETAPAMIYAIVDQGASGTLLASYNVDPGGGQAYSAPSICATAEGDVYCTTKANGFFKFVPSPLPTGACCLADGSCDEADFLDCGDAGGLYQGNGTTCVPNPCPQPTGACCYPDGTCTVTLQADCPMGCWTMFGTCEPNTCPAPTEDYTNDFSSLDNFVAGVGYPPYGPMGPAYLSYGDTAVSTDVAADATPGYMQSGLFYTLPQSGSPPSMGVPPSAYPAFDCSAANLISLTWRFDGPEAKTGQTMGLWLRVYTGTYNCATGRYVDIVRRGFFFPAPVNGGWTTLSKDFTFNETESKYPNVPGNVWKPGSVYAFRLEPVYWDQTWQPNTISFGDFRIFRGPGACCFSDGSCDDTLIGTECAAAGGTFKGAGTVCTPVNPCPQPGACCHYPSGTCYMSTVVAPGDCAEGDVYQGDDTDCSTPCPAQPGACCVLGVCTMVVEADCTGEFLGQGTFCTPNPCPPYCNPFDTLTGITDPAVYINTLDGDTGAFKDFVALSGYMGFGVALPSTQSWGSDARFTISLRVDDPDHTLGPDGTNAFGFLRIYSSNGARTIFGISTPTNQGWSSYSDCISHGADENGIFDRSNVTRFTIEKIVWSTVTFTLGLGDFCITHDAACVGACCMPDGSCDDTGNERDCAAAGGSYRGDGSTCLLVECPQPEACCFLNGDCQDLLVTACMGLGGYPQGPASTCETADCPPSGACCLGNPACRCEIMTEAECLGAGGVYHAEVPCPAICLTTSGIIYVAMDQQISTPSGDVIGEFTGLGSGFKTNGVDGWVRRNVNPADGWPWGPRVDFNRAYGTLDTSAGVTLEYTTRYFQGGGNTNPYGDAPVASLFYDSATPTPWQCNHDWEFQTGYGLGPGLPRGDPHYPTWKAVSHVLPFCADWYTDGGFDATQVNYARFMATDWSGTGQDFYDIKDFLIYTGATPTGACCEPDGDCTVTDMVTCVNVNGGMWKGPCTICADAGCVPVPGACCLPDGSCELRLAADCPPEAFFHGEYSECPSPPDYPCLPGVCCLPTGCILTLSDLCLAQGGTPGPVGSTCADACPPNDLCANAIAVAVPSATPGDNTLATSSDPVPGGAPECNWGQTDVWYTLVGDGYDITVDTCATRPTFDSVINVYTGPCDNLTYVACNDDYNDCIVPPGWSGLSRVTFTSVADQTYIVRVAGFQKGPFVLTVTTAIPLGACCVGPVCTPNKTQAQCVTEMSGVWYEGADCFPNPCGPPMDYWMDTATQEQGTTPPATAWIPYPSGWINAWWPNEFDLTRKKLVEITFTVQFAGPAPTVAVNYARVDWLDPQYPPSIDEYVVRIPVDPPVTLPGEYTFSTLLPFCPLWVSVDVMKNSGDFTIEGTIVHTCLP